MKPNRLAGHTMPGEGRLYDARCSCGAESEQIYTSGSRRRTWFYDHKDDVRRGGDGVVWTGAGGEA